MQTYLVPIYAPPTPTLQQAQVYRALLHKDSMTLQNADVPSAYLSHPHLVAKNGTT